MKALREFRRFILIKLAEGHPGEVRSYIIDNIARLAVVFGVPAECIVQGTELTKNDRLLATRYLEIVIRAEIMLRQSREERRARAAQESADILAATTKWKGNRAHLDMVSLLSSALTRRQDMLVFTCDGFTTAIPMALLLDLSRIARVRNDLTGFVDRDGLHLRWRTGGLHLRSHTDARAAKVIVSLPPKPAVVAA